MEKDLGRMVIVAEDGLVVAPSFQAMCHRLPGSYYLASYCIAEHHRGQNILPPVPQSHPPTALARLSPPLAHYLPPHNSGAGE